MTGTSQAPRLFANRHRTAAVHQERKDVAKFWGKAEGYERDNRAIATTVATQPGRFPHLEQWAALVLARQQQKKVAA